MGIIDDNLNWDLTITNNGINNYFENITNTTISVGETKSIRVGSTLLADQIFYNAKQRNALKKADYILVEKQSVNQNNGGNFNFSLQELNLVATAEKIYSTMQLTPDLDNFIQGTSAVGDVKTVQPPPPELFYDAYTLSNAQNMLLQQNNMFVPDEANNPFASFSGDIEALANSQYKINIGDQLHTYIYFRSSQNEESLEIYIDNVSLRVQVAGQTAYSSNVTITEIVFKVDQTVQLLSCNGSNNVNPNNGALPSNYDMTSLLVSKVSGADVVEHSQAQYVQLARGNNLVALRPLSAYFKATKGKFTLSFDSSNLGAFYLFNLENQPIDKLTYSEVAANYLNNMALAIQNNADGNLFLSFGSVVAQPALSLQFSDASGIEDFTFDLIDLKTIDVYRKLQKVGTVKLSNELLPYFQTACELPMPLFNSFGFNLSQSFELLNYKLPDTASDGDIFHLQSGGTLFNKELLVGDYITVYANKTNVSINRLPEGDKRKSLYVSLVTASGTSIDNIFAIYDVEIGIISLSGYFYMGSPYTGSLFLIDVTDIPIKSTKNSYSINNGDITPLTISSMDDNTLAVVLNNSSATGQHVIINSVIAEVSV
ncbi:hypothetical protein ACSFV5_07425 [Acinetobacter sp. HC8-3S]